jgi:hypothetical protein
VISPEHLERLLAAAALDPAERPAFTRALIESSVLVLGAAVHDPHSADEQGMVININRLRDGDGLVAPFFTSERMLRATLDAVPRIDRAFMKMRCRYFFEVARSSRSVLNPHGLHSKLFTPDEAEAYIESREPGMRTVVIDSDREVLVGSPARVPPDLPAVLARYLVQRPVVEAAHLGWIVHPDGHAGYLLVVAAGDRDQVLQGFGSVAIGEVTGGHSLDVIVHPPGDDNHVLSSVAPFYRRPLQPDT